MKNPTRDTLLLALLVACGVLLAPPSAAQTADAAAPSAPAPEAVVRNFYAWYLGQLNKENWEPLKNRREALKYLTSEFHKRIPRLEEDLMADIIICAQEWEPKWATDYTVGRATIRGAKASTVVRLPVGNDTAIKIKTTLVKRGGAWKIDGTECVN